jgi:subtilase family serine protease
VDVVDNSRRTVVRGNLHRAARPESDQGPLDPGARLNRVTLVFKLTPEQQADLETLLHNLHDRSSPDYRRWLTPETFGERYGLSQNDLDKVTSWLQTRGLAIEQVSRSRTWVAFSGTVRQVEAAFRTELRRYAVGGETRYANSTEPSVPSAFAHTVLGFRGLREIRLKPRRFKKTKIRPRFTSELTQNHFLAPDDLATIYNLKPLYDSGITGAGQRVAVVGQSAVSLSDIQTFRSLSGLPVNQPQVILVPQSFSGDPDPGMLAGDVDEASLDLEWIGAVARGATILYVYSSNVLDAFAYVVEQNLAPVLSISYGACENGPDGFNQADANLLSSIAQQGNAQGITIVGPSGDSGAADCDHDDEDNIADQGLAVDLPAALPYVTAVGGTRFNEGAGIYWNPTNDANNASALSYIPEIAWNDTPPGEPFAATGGGSSIFFAKPGWQVGSGAPGQNSRHVPDVSFNASAEHDGYLVCSQDDSSGSFQPTCTNGFRDGSGNLTVFGGTSVGVPVFAGIVALINQQMNTPQGQGNVNYTLYPLAASFPAAFHDITSGDNRVPCQAGSPDCPAVAPFVIGFSAGAGYDRVTGLGSIDAFNLVTAWSSVSATPASKGSTAPDFQLALSPPSLTVLRGGSTTAQLSVTAINGFSSSVSVSCSVPAALAGVTCSVTGGPGLGTRTVTIQASGGASAGLIVPETVWFGIVGIGALVIAVICCGAGRAAPRWRFAPVVALACLMIAGIGCAGDDDDDGPDPNPSAVVLQGASGAITHTAELTVTVE